ncbi:MAG: hypothetical protein GY787_19660, partial [Alteromonadales bacterium]|nr:hypothetical protein [Alteromonadales bacterium]
NSSTENLVDNTELIRGDNFYKGTEVPNGGSITVAADNGSGKPAILYLGEGVSWVNVKLNANGQAKDLIIYVNSAVNISGDDTQINAIIYVNGTLVVTDKAEIRGALAAIANISISTEVQVSYEQSAIANTDFNGMCGNNTIAMCEVIFPGSNPFAAVTPLSTNSEFKPISECNDSQCVVNDVTTVIARTPTIPSGGSDVGELNKASLSDEDYNFYSGWQSDKTEVVYSSNSGTAVIYIKSSSDVILPDELELNEDGEVANLLLVIESSTKIEIGKESQIKAFMYLVAPEIQINEEVDIEGGITVDTDKLIVEKDSEFDYESDELEGFNPHGFCQAPAILENNPILDYRFDECSYTGGSDDVIDQTGNYNADSNNVIDPVNDAAINNSLDLRPLNTVRVTPNWLQVPKNAINGLDDFTVAFWVKTPASDVSGKTRQQVLHALGKSTSDNQLGIYLRNSDKVVIEVQNESETLDSGTTLTNDTWYHLTLTRQDEDVCLFVNGVSKDCVDDVNEGALSITNDDAVVIGQEQDSFGGGFSTAQSFEGNLDEFKIYSSVLSSSEINTIYLNEVAGKYYDGKVRVTPACPTLHHFEINTLDARGITCQADQITIKACADESCSTVHPDEIDVKLFVNDVEKKTVSVSGANGTTTTYSHATVGNAVLKVKSFGHTYQCTNNLAGSSCNVSFKDSGFVISNIPMQISGKSSGEGFNSTTLSLRAVEKNTTTGVCDNVFPDDTEVAVKLSYTCAGGDCKDLLSLSNNGKSYNLTDTATSKDLYFSNNSTANFSLKYPHAAKFIINAKKDVEVTDSDDNTEIKDFSVSSNAFVVRPFAFKLDFSSGTNSANAHAQNGSGNPDASQSAFKKAGETFKLTATAVQWRDGQDNSPIDGIPDNFSVINSNLTAGNFSDGPLTIIHSLLLPKASDWEPGLLATKRSNDFVNSVITNEYSYSEVGIIKLSVNLS